jgi:hypothetical protein
VRHRLHQKLLERDAITADQQCPINGEAFAERRGSNRRWNSVVDCGRSNEWLFLLNTLSKITQ